jgi:hypothetical protein
MKKGFVVDDELQLSGANQLSSAIYARTNICELKLCEIALEP